MVVLEQAEFSVSRWPILESFLPNAAFKTPDAALWSQRKKLPIEANVPLTCLTLGSHP